MRFGLELIEAVREAWPVDKPLLVRVSCVDGSGGGWSIEDTVVFAAELKQRGVDLIDCSSGGINGPLTLSVVPRDAGYHIPFAECVRRDVASRRWVRASSRRRTRQSRILPKGDAISSQSRAR